MKETNLDKLMYEAGLTAQGCWDEMDTYAQEAILKLSKLIVNQCIEIVGKSGAGCQSTTFDKSIVECTRLDAVTSIKNHFDIKEELPWYVKQPN
jgi:hypothetical protein